MVLLACSAVIEGACIDPEPLQVFYLSGVLLGTAPIIASIATMICVAGGFNLLSRFTAR